MSSVTAVRFATHLRQRVVEGAVVVALAPAVERPREQLGQRALPAPRDLVEERVGQLVNSSGSHRGSGTEVKTQRAKKGDAATSARPHQLELFGGAAVPLDLGLVGEPRVVANVDDGLEQLERLLHQLCVRNGCERAWGCQRASQ